MVAYQGDVNFEHAGSGGMGRMLKKAVTGEGTTLMKMSGTGEVFLADTAQDIHLLYLENDSITINGREPARLRRRHRLGHPDGSGGAAARWPAASSTCRSSGTGWVAILSDGPPVLLDVGSGADVRRPAGGDHVVVRRQHDAQDRREAARP